MPGLLNAGATHVACAGNVRANHASRDHDIRPSQIKSGTKADAAFAVSELFGGRSAKLRKTRANSKPRKGGRNTMRMPGWTSASVDSAETGVQPKPVLK